MVKKRKKIISCVGVSFITGMCLLSCSPLPKNIYEKTAKKTSEKTSEKKSPTPTTEKPIGTPVTKKNLSQLPSPQHQQQNWEVPLDANHWYTLQYSSIKAHTVYFLPKGILIQVRSSASPVIYPMTDHPLNVTGVTIKGEVNKLLPIQPPIKQGTPGLDDFSLRLGLVLAGTNTLQWHQKLFAPNWITEMYKLAPAGQGIDYIYFLNAVLSPTLLNKTRTHPLSEYIQEHYVWLMNKPRYFSFSHILPRPKQVLGLWISSDGDDTQSTFDLQIQHLSLSHYEL